MERFCSNLIQNGRGCTEYSGKSHFNSTQTHDIRSCVEFQKALIKLTEFRLGILEGSVGSVFIPKERRKTGQPSSREEQGKWLTNQRLLRLKEALFYHFLFIFFTTLSSNSANKIKYFPRVSEMTGSLETRLLPDDRKRLRKRLKHDFYMIYVFLSLVCCSDVPTAPWQHEHVFTAF